MRLAPRGSVSARPTLASGDDIVDRDVANKVLQDTEDEIGRVALLVGGGLAGQLDVHLAGEQLGLSQFQRERQLMLLVRHDLPPFLFRLEARRVGKERRSRWP